MILCLGTTPTLSRTMTFAKLSINDVNRASHVHQYASGKSVNAARVLHSLGERCVATGIVGGETGAAFLRDLDESGVGHAFVQCDAPTRVCITIIDESAGTATELIEEPAAPGLRALSSLWEKLEALLPEARVLVVSGSLAPGASDDSYAQCVRLARSANVETIIDATGMALSRALGERPGMVKVNRRELAETLNVAIDSDESLRDAMRSTMSLGARRVIVTSGPGAVLACDGTHWLRISPPTVKIQSAIGSGDAFAAGLAAGILRKQSFKDACVLAAACAVANAITPHAGHVAQDEVDRLSKRIVVERS